MVGKTNATGGESKLTGNATLAAVLNGYTFYSDDPKVKKVGNMPNHGAWNNVISAGYSSPIPAGYHNGSGTISATPLTGNAPTGAVLAGHTFYNSGPSQQVGVMPNRGAWATTINSGTSIAIPAGYHNGSGSVTATSQGILAGYKLVTGSLVGIPANWTTDAAARGFSIPAGCIPLILQMEGCTVFTGKGETAKLIIKVYDNSGSNIFYVERTNSGYLGTGQIAISPMALYRNNIESLKGITAIYQKIYNQEEGLLSEYNCGALTVTTWLQKV